MAIVSRVEPRLPKGMRDLLPEDMIRRRYVIETVQETFEAFGFEPMQTPALELRDVLMGKYGPDAEKLIYLAQHPQGREELALRYDLSVPLSRVIAMHQDLARPFRRYQIAPVWRAERPQRGKYREFFQCDVDIVGTPSMLADAEIVAVVAEVLARLGFAEFSIRLNNRKLLSGIGEFAGVPEPLRGGLYRAIDKLERLGADGVRAELDHAQVPSGAVTRLLRLLEVGGSSARVLEELAERLVPHQDAIQGIAELRQILAALDEMGVPSERISVDPAMVRGLEYYTGPIFETVVERPRIGSLTGGGRYDSLIGMFAGRAVPATGTSIGIERIIDVMGEMKMFPGTVGRTLVQVLVTVFADDLRPASLAAAAALRRGGFRTEIYLETRPVRDQLRYAQRKGVPYVVLVGPEERSAGRVRIKRMDSGEERLTAPEAAAGEVRRWSAS